MQTFDECALHDLLQDGLAHPADQQPLLQEAFPSIARSLHGTEAKRRGDTVDTDRIAALISVGNQVHVLGRSKVDHDSYEKGNHPQHVHFKEQGAFETFPHAVSVGMTWRKLIDVNVIDNTFRAQVTISVYWFDPAFATQEYSNTLNAVVQANSQPVLFLDNCLALEEYAFQVDKLSSDTRDMESVTLRRWGLADPPGSLRMSGHFTGVFTESFDLHRFPCDVQTLTIRLRMWGAGVENRYDYGRFFVFCSNDVDNDIMNVEWNVHTPACRTIGKLHHKQAVESMLVISRKPGHYTRTVLLPLFGLTSCAFTAFLIETADLGGRLSIIFTMLLTVVAFKLLIADKLPKLAYSTDVDFYVDACSVFLFVVCLANVMSSLGEHLVGSSLAFICSMAWLAFNVYYLFYYQGAAAYARHTFGAPLGPGDDVNSKASLEPKLVEIAAARQKAPSS